MGTACELASRVERLLERNELVAHDSFRARPRDWQTFPWR